MNKRERVSKAAANVVELARKWHHDVQQGDVMSPNVCSQFTSYGAERFWGGANAVCDAIKEYDDAVKSE